MRAKQGKEASRAILFAVGLAVGVWLVARPASAQTCGSVLLAERGMPAVFQGITIGASTVARMWAAGSGGTSYSTNACLVGCRSFAVSPRCNGNGDCIAITGVNWLNAVCASAGLRPARTVFLVEAPTSANGGRWAAFDLDKNSADANVDLDAKAGSTASVASPLIGGSGQPINVFLATKSGTVVTLHLGWQAPASAAEALNNSGASLVKSYSIVSKRSSGGIAPAMTGDKTGWTRVADADSASLGGYSTDAAATVAIDTQGSAERIYVAIGLNLDGTGNPDADVNTKVSSYISRGTLVYDPAAPTPTVTTISPPLGLPEGGTSVSIGGTGFVAGATVTFGGALATDVSVSSSTTITARTPAHAAGAVDVAVTNPGSASGVKSAGFTYGPILRGDTNSDGSVTTPDVFYLINYLFSGGPPPATTCQGDANTDLTVTSPDVFFLINYLYSGGPAPNPPNC